MLTSNRAFNTGIFLAFLLLFVSASAFSLAHCHGEHEHGKEAGDCALCAFACHVAAAFLAIVSSSLLALVCRMRQLPSDHLTLGTIWTLQPIRAPPPLFSAT